MPGLWADGWFYISSAGLLVSGALFFFLLGQYRAAADAADDAHTEEAVSSAPATVPISRVYVPIDDEPKSAPVASVASAPAAAKEKDPLSTGSTTTGGISPAVVYLQNLKVQLEDMGGELRGLTKKVNAVSERDEALIERLAELARAVEELRGAVLEPPTPKRRKSDKPAAAPEPEPVVAASVAAPVPAPEPVAAPEPAPVVVAAAAEPEPVSAGIAALVAAVPEPEPASATPPTTELKIELGTAAGAGAPVEAAVPAADAPNPESTVPADQFKAALEGEAAKPEEEKPRRGPVWPV